MSLTDTERAEIRQKYKHGYLLKRLAGADFFEDLFHVRAGISLLLGTGIRGEG